MMDTASVALAIRPDLRYLRKSPWGIKPGPKPNEYGLCITLSRPFDPDQAVTTEALDAKVRDLLQHPYSIPKTAQIMDKSVGWVHWRIKVLGIVVKTKPSRAA